MKVVVTGGAGFIGANLVRCLRDDGRHVVVVDNLSTGSLANLAGIEGATVLQGSVLDDDLLDQAFEHADAVVHLAALPSVPRSLRDPIASHDNNATGTLKVLEAARRAGGLHVVLASSSSVYGTTEVLPKHEGLPVAPRSPYAASKLAAESYALAYGASFDLPVLAFRFFNVFGPLQPAGHAYAAVIPAFVDAAMRGHSLTIHGDGHQTRDFTFVGSVVAVLADACRRVVTSDRPVNLAFGTRRTLLEVVSNLEAALGRSLPVDHTAPRAGDVRDSMADPTLLRTLFPDIEPVDFEEGLALTVDWFASLDATEPEAPTR